MFALHSSQVVCWTESVLCGGAAGKWQCPTTTTRPSTTTARTSTNKAKSATRILKMRLIATKNADHTNINRFFRGSRISAILGLRVRDGFSDVDYFVAVPLPFRRNVSSLTLPDYRATAAYVRSAARNGHTFIGGVHNDEGPAVLIQCHRSVDFCFDLREANPSECYRLSTFNV